MIASAFAALLVFSLPAAPEDPPDPLWQELDARFVASMEAFDIPGGGFIVVREDRLAHAKVHGFADLAAQRPVDFDRTLFYTASVTKSFSAVAVLQGVESGALDLDADVNAYLGDLRIPAAFDRPVTLRHLLTHSAGFDDRLIGHAALTAEAVQPLASYLAASLPERIVAPGRISSYSNHGFGLAGLAVETTAGRPFADIVEQRILAPLGMTRSTARLPPPPHLARDLATGYRYDAARDDMVPHPLGYRNQPPAGSVSVTLADMVPFLRALVGDGSASGGRILAPETVAVMRQRQFSHHPRLPGFAFGFWEREVRGHRVLEHAGGALGACALIAIVPERGIGFFAAANQSTVKVLYDVLEALLTALFPAPARVDRPPVVLEGAARRSRRVEGTYRHTRYPRRSFLKLALLGGQVRVRAAGPGHIAVTEASGETSSWREVAPLLFRQDVEDAVLAFGGAPEGGPVSHLYRSYEGTVPSAYERLAWFDTQRWQLAFVAILLVALGSVPARWPILAGIRRLRRRGRPPSALANALPRSAVAAAFLAAAVSLAFLVLLVGQLASPGSQIRLAYGLPPALRATLFLPLALVPIVAATVFACARAWLRRHDTLVGRIHYTLVAGGAVGVLIFLAHWNLLGPG